MSGLVIKKKEGESVNSLIFRFSKKVQQSGVVREVKGRRFFKRAQSKAKMRLSALHRVVKAKEIERDRKLGLL